MVEGKRENDAHLLEHWHYGRPVLLNTTKYILGRSDLKAANWRNTAWILNYFEKYSLFARYIVRFFLDVGISMLLLTC